MPVINILKYVCVFPRACLVAMQLRVSWLVLLLGLQCVCAQQDDYEEDYDDEEVEERSTRKKAKSKLLTPNLVPKDNARCK